MRQKTWAWMLLLLAIALGGCQRQSTDGCHIHGTVKMADLNGKRIFLVPLYGPKTAEYVDSVVVKNGQFEFDTDTVMMAKILMDYHYRSGVQALLVVTEPGNLEVVIDSVSSCSGTPQNDTLQVWKDLTERHNRIVMPASRMAYILKQRGDTAQAAVLEKQASEARAEHKRQTRQKAASMKGTILGEFLETLYPLTYKQKMPDGSTVIMNSDTHEPVE